MRFKEAVSLTLILSQVVLSSSVFADSSASRPSSSQNSPELILLTSAIALTGQDLPKEQLQQAIVADVKQYESTAPVEGRDARTEQALVDMGVFTPLQAHAFELQIENATSDLGKTQFTTSQQAAEVLGQELASLPMPAGAEFSAGRCAENIGLAIFGAAVMVEGIQYAQGSNIGVDILSGFGAFLGFAVFLGMLPRLHVCVD